MKLNSVLIRLCCKLILGWILFNLLFALFTRPAAQQSWGLSSYFGGQFGLFVVLVKTLMIKVVLLTLIVYVFLAIVALLGKNHH